MNNRSVQFAKSLLLMLILSMAGLTVFSQNYLYKPVRINIKQEKLYNALLQIEQQGDFHFAYSSGIIRGDSLVTLQNFNGNVKTALDMLIGDAYEYQQSPNHLIIRPAPFRLTLMPEEVGEGGKVYTIKGYVVDEKTGEGIRNASVYEKRLLIGTMTNKKGHFKLKLRTKSAGPLILTVSKELYKDTTTIFLPTANVGQDMNGEQYGYSTEKEGASNTALARLFLSSKQRLNALNLGNFFAYTPVQVSLTPGLSSHGVMSGQIVNKFSANLIGGYTAGVEGVELAGIFNIDRYHVRYVQLAGVVNVVGGDLSGVQLSGVYNAVMDSLKGVQAAGVTNISTQQVNGVQLAGISNYTSNLKGMQIAGVVNKAKNNRGVQFGFVNIADTSSGVSIGLVNIIGNGFKRLSFSTNEALYANISFKSGNPKLYSVIAAGIGSWNGTKVQASGFGVGHEFNRRKKNNYFATELIVNQLYGSKYENVVTWPKLSLLYNFSINKKTKVFVAPSVNLLVKNKQVIEDQQNFLPADYPYIIDKERAKLWAGLAVGISFF